YRKLSPEEISSLERNACLCDDWDKVQVAWGEDSYVSRISDVTFSGDIRLGRFEGDVKMGEGISVRCGIRHAYLHNVSVGDSCLIRKIGEYISNYDFGSHCIIDNIDVMSVEGECSFGNGVEVSVLNETGGREVVITDNLSAHLAYVMALYRHRSRLHGILSNIARDYAKEQTSTRGTVGNDVSIRNCGSITGVKVGDCASLIGASRLYNGTIVSNVHAPVFVGSGVKASDFIICSGSKVEDGAMMTRCFVGQSCILGHGYSASDSLFFSNCQGENGEACAIFAGPFTVTHHKSTLLIAGMFSFMNAGSGSNQSNHMYKLGPIHQGILERGAKTASDSYILWPSRVGAFSLVMGRHVTHSDTTNLPFSYLIEQNNTTYLVPGVNLRSVGTIRDAQKWPKRDARKDPERMDYINYNLLSPFTIQKMFKGLKTLRNLLYASGELSDIYSFHSTKIRNSSLRKGIFFYETGIRKFLGNSLIKRLENLPAGASDQEIQAMLRPDTEIGHGDWVDISGLIAPKSEVVSLMDGIESGQINSVRQINDCFKVMHENYYTYEWTWAYDKIKEFFGYDPDTMTAEQAMDIVSQWKEAVIGLDKMVYEDAKKEFSLSSMTGFGMDGTKEEKELDFEQVRGDFEGNTFVNAVIDHIEKKSALGDDLLSRLKR
ncbi:MAG: DUF4954 family protein, partial [Bacteroidales bacterium]|nr:DUF4954 family protein [Bacteroidales bacterium]